MKKYIVILLMLVSANALLADSTISQSGSISLSREIPAETRVITQAEFEGTDSISIKLNQSLVIPIHYQKNSISNDVSVFFGAADKSIMNVVAAGIDWSDNGKNLDLNLICTGTEIGQTKVLFGEGGTVIKEFTIQVEE